MMALFGDTIVVLERVVELCHELPGCQCMMDAIFLVETFGR